MTIRIAHDGPILMGAQSVMMLELKQCGRLKKIDGEWNLCDEPSGHDGLCSWMDPGLGLEPPEIVRESP